MGDKLFDLEQNIMKCWSVTDDIDTLYKNVMERPKLTTDDIANVLLGMKTLYHMKFEECFGSFESFVSEYWTMKKQLQSINPKEYVE